jgi:hypothetical protein
MVKNPNNKRALQRAAASYFSLKEYQKAMECYSACFLVGYFKTANDLSTDKAFRQINRS